MLSIIQPIVNNIEQFLTESSSNDITNIFFAILIILFFIALIFHFLGKWKNFTDYSPTFLTSISILGTFTGIVSGLLNFDINDIDGSISQLLGGMKTAFLTSVIGITLSLLLKVVFSISIKKHNKGSTDSKDLLNTFNTQAQHIEALKEGITGQGPNSLLSQINTFKTEIIDTNQKLLNIMGSDTEGSLLGQLKLLRTDFSDQHKHIEALKEGITGQGPNSLLSQINTFKTEIIDANQKLLNIMGSDTEGSLLGQLKLLRTDFSDRHKQLENLLTPINTLTNIKVIIENQQNNFESFRLELKKQMESFAEMLSKSATEQVINALKEVITEFNQKLTEQFGENFKELNRAVMALVDWQERYRQQLEQMIEQYQLGIKAISDTEKSVQHIEQSSQTIPTTMAALSEVMTVNQHQISELANHLNAFSELKENAVKAVPEIQQNIQTMLENVSNATQNLTNGLSASSEHLAKSLENSTANLMIGINESSAKLTQSIEHSTNTLNESIQQNNRSLADTATTIKQRNDEMSKNLDNSVKELEKRIQRWTEDFDTSVKQVHNSFTGSMDKMIKEQIESSKKLMSGLTSESENALKATTESMAKQLGNIDKSMQEEINRTMQQMGNALATITRQFTNDYTTLVNEMQKVINAHRQNRY
ncbi:hypothetical protein [Rodentibacter trehalosifermentans]|uniref:MotA/TolQ/ExbB proton channel domain-containing protein n=1 Tax=Rodentibacter trehalosifermentans TaxID=1908263 RepID=A0A1V3J3D1_9PAST|nr:hypothetical protein [Rodentibacter trehalosifermentans]OOF49487.1 hypothetical protein BKK52_02960 [Rodentibacter trehalosifermentans]OOF52470.1 hypothetical protein BKK53_05085 [Rodentibacter trehalosifermentans]